MSNVTPRFRRVLIVGAALAAAIISCGREVTAPVAPAVRLARGFSLEGVFPPMYQAAGGGSLVPFTRVHVVLRRADGSVAIDTTVDFPAGASELTLSLTVPIAAGAPATGEPMTANLGYVNAAGETVFSGTMPVTVAPSVPGQPAPPPVQVPVQYTGTGSNAASVVISPKSFAGLAGASTTFTAQVLSTTGSVLTGTPMVFTSSAAGIAKLASPTSGAVTLVARGSAWIKVQTLTGQADSAQVTVSLPASKIELVSGSGQTADVGTALEKPIVAKVTASDGVPVSGITVSLAASNSGSVSPATATTDATGQVSANWTLGNVAGSQTLSITSAGLTGSPISVTATAKSLPAVKLDVQSQPTDAVAGASIGTVKVRAVDKLNNVVPTFTGDVSVSLAGGTSGATLSGTTTVKAIEGVATFSGLTVARPGTGYTLSFAASGLTSATSSAFAISAASSSRLVFTVQPQSRNAGQVLAPPIKVSAQDAFGNSATSFNGAVTIAFGANPGGGTLSGTLTQTAVAGVATFSDLSIRAAGTGYTLVASTSGLTSATSDAFDIAKTAPAGLVLISGGGQSAVGLGVLSPITVRVIDAQDNGLAGLTVAFAVVTGNGIVTPTSATTDAHGDAVVTWKLGPSAGVQSIKATYGSLPALTITGTATTTVAVNTLKLTTDPGAFSRVAGANFPTFVVEGFDTANVAVTGNYAISAEITGNPAGISLLGTTGIGGGGPRTFSTLNMTKVGTYSLTFTAPGMTSVSTSSFTITPAQGLATADSGSGQSALPGTALPKAFVVRFADTYGNPIVGSTVNWTVTGGGGSVTPPSSITDANGRARATLTLGASPGTNTVTASITGNGNIGTFSATGTGTVIASTAVSPKVDTIVSFGATRAMSVSSKDPGNNTVVGTYTWVSRTPSVAIVDTLGNVKSVANGSTWVVVTETGGTKDSALIVVQQRVATIVVTPGTRNIYRTGKHKFTAAAVDGMSNVMPGITAFTWTTVTPSVASVDTGGTVTAVAIGSTQVRATANSITGVATVSVLTPIIRIAVGRDSSGVPVTDTTSLTSLGIGRFFRAEAHDTLDAVMTGVTFTWASTNSSVALMDSISATRARALSNANGITTIQATADGVTGSSALKVSQVMASIELTPTPDTIGVGGTAQLTARGKDANGRYTTGGSFTYASSATGVATVTSGGLVAGVALGTANVTATAGSLTSNAAVIVVTSTVPPIISFGRDTLTVGRGSSASIPILLSRTNASAVTVNLAARDTNAYFSPTSVTIPAGSNSVNATMYGRNAGTTQVYATDGSGTGYRGDTAAVAVTANMRLATSSWSLNAGDQVATQVLLSDPSPAGGTYVTFSYGTAGKAQVSPDPAFIPAGQLASNIVITSLGTTTGSTTITPVATGVNGTASTMYVYAPVLTMSAGASAQLGTGQYESGWYVYSPQYMSNALPLTYTSTDTNIVTVSPASGSIPAGSYYHYFTVSGRAAGTAKVIVSSAGWQPDTLAMTISSPRTTICCAYSLNTTSPVTNMTVYVGDSIGTSHYRTSSLALTISSSDTNVIKIIDKNPSVAAGYYYASGIRVQPGGTGGTAYVKVVAGGHRPDSTLITVVGPKLEGSWTSLRLGKGQYEPNQYVYTPNNVTTPLTVTVTSSDTNKVKVPATVTIPTGSYYAYFSITGADTGSVSIKFSAPGYQGDTTFVQVTSPRVTSCCGGTLRAFGPGTTFYAYSADSVGTTHYRSTPLAVSLRSTDTNVVKLDSSVVTIPAGAYYTYNAHVSAIGTGSAYIVATAAGHKPDSMSYTVTTPQLGFSFYSALLGQRQYYTPTDFYITTPDYRTSALAVTLTQKHGTVDSLTATALTIPTSSYYAYFGLAGMTPGVDTIIASAPGYLPDTAFIRVGPRKLTQCCMPSTALTTYSPSSITVYAADSVGTTHWVMDTVVLKVTSSDTTVIKPTAPYVRIPRGQYYTTAGFGYFGPGSATLTFADSAGSAYGSVTTSAVTVTGPSLYFSSTSAMYGMRQTGYSGGDYYVYAQNNVASALTVNLISTDTRVATVPATVTIPAGSYYAYFNITAKDTIGTIQVQATATGYGAPTPMNVQVTQPKFVISTSTNVRTTQGAQTMTIYATDANGTAHYTTEAVTVNLSSTAPGVATVDSSTVTIPAGAYYNSNARWSPVAVGTAQVAAADSRAALYKYNTGTANLAVTTPSLYLSWSTFSLGRGQYIDPSEYYYYVSTPDYMPSATAVTLSHSGAAKTTVPASVTIPASSYYSYFKIAATTFGTDTLVASLSSPAHVPDTAFVVVDSGRVDTFGGWPSASMVVGDSMLVTLYTRDPGQGVRRVSAATTFAISTNSSIEFHQANAVVTSVTVPADASQVQFYVKAKAAGSGIATFTNANYRSYTPPTITVTP